MCINIRNMFMNKQNSNYICGLVQEVSNVILLQKKS